MNQELIFALVSLGGLGFVLGAGLAYASKKFAVEVNPVIEEVLDILPGANCGGCGYAGCAAYAEAVVTKGIDTTLCAPGGQDTIQNIAQILGQEAKAAARKVVYLHCNGTKENAKDKQIIQKTVINGEYVDKPHMWNFFDCIHDPETKTYLGEDFSFCKLWTEIGGKCHAFIDDPIAHIGEHQYEGRFADELILPK